MAPASAGCLLVATVFLARRDTFLESLVRSSRVALVGTEQVGFLETALTAVDVALEFAAPFLGLALCPEICFLLGRPRLFAGFSISCLLGTCCFALGFNSILSFSNSDSRFSFSGGGSSFSFSGSESFLTAPKSLSLSSAKSQICELQKMLAASKEFQAVGHCIYLQSLNACVNRSKRRLWDTNAVWFANQNDLWSHRLGLSRIKWEKKLVHNHPSLYKRESSFHIRKYLQHT